MILLYTTQLTNRINYTFDLVFSKILTIPYKITTSLQEIEKYNGAKLIYTKEHHIPTIPFIEADNLLFEETIVKQNLEVSIFENFHIFFQKENPSALLPFDLFACAFFMASRYEEYLPYVTDLHQRFEAKTSFAFKNNFLKEPIVNQHAYLLREKLGNIFPELIIKEQHHTNTITLDIDNAYAYQNKGFRRNVLSLGKKLVEFKLIEFNKQLAILSRSKNDPYDSYDKQFEVHQKYKIKPIYFFLVGDYNTYDRNISHRKKGLKKLISTIKNTNADIGIHPSYASYLKEKKIKKEKKRLEKITKEQVTKSRQHYLKFKIPKTYQQLNTLGITDDYSMGFASKIGFRAGLCTPFNFFDLTINETTPLLIHPFCMMDTTLKQYLKIPSKNVIPYIKPIFDKIKAVNGNIHLVFHNESIGAKNEWKNWKNIYQKTILLALDD